MIQSATLPVLFLTMYMYSLSAAPADTLAAETSPSDTSLFIAPSKTDTSTADTAVLSDSTTFPGGNAVADTTPAESLGDDSVSSGPATSPPRLTGIPHHGPEDTQTDSTDDSLGVPDGSFFAAGIGWSLGSFELLDIWENTLPDSLEHFGLTATSFQLGNDTSEGQESSVTDTGRIAFSVKEEPAVYTMSFPLRISFVKIRDKSRLALSMSGSFMRKTFSATISPVNEDISRKVDYIESVNVYSLFLGCAYGRRIPAEYFSIEGVERTTLSAAVEFSPLIACHINRKVKAPGDDTRLQIIREKISSPKRRLLHGGAGAFRIGLTLLKRLSRKSASEISAWYTVQFYHYFHEGGNRIYFRNVDRTDDRKDQPLYWTSNRFELSFSFIYLGSEAGK